MISPEKTSPIAQHGEAFATNIITPTHELALISGARDIGPVRGFTHGFYKYPARFSPAFARAAIQAFTSPGDWVLDNHVGGGTTLVECMSLGRNSIGIDISSLATFVSEVKTTIFTEIELTRLLAWSKTLDSAIDMRRPSIYFEDYDQLGYYKYLDSPSRWRLRKAVEQALGAAICLNDTRLESFARCAVLRTSQWALDGRKSLPSIGEFRSTLRATTAEMIEGARQLRERIGLYKEPPTTLVFNRTSAGIETELAKTSNPAPRLVLTSPPYPGVHVLYHRWQVDGRKESALPFMIANKLDGEGISYYTMGGRKSPKLKAYFDAIKLGMSSVAALSDDNTIVVQMIAFNDPSWQLPKYLETMEEAGLVEVLLPSLQGIGDGRLWRTVPNRRWYSEQRGETGGSQELVLLHRKAPIPLPPLDRQHRRHQRDRPGQAMSEPT